MLQNNPVFLEDVAYASSVSSIPWEALSDSRVLITGATGLIGFNLAAVLAARGDITVLAGVRNRAKAEALFDPLTQGRERIEIVDLDVLQPIRLEGRVDYILHCASQTDSKGFVQRPAETIDTAFLGTRSILALAREKQVKGMVFLSTMEVYGHPPKGHRVKENEIGALSPLEVRNSYPLSKIACESLCVAWAKEYGIPVTILRLTQTFGPGVAYGDGRVFADFARHALEGTDIVLHTTGETSRSYLYTADAVTAVLTALLRGERGAAYSAANERSYCTIAQMAKLVGELGGVGVRIEPADAAAMGYASTLYMDLDTSALRALGWEPRTELREMYRRMMACMAPEGA